MSKIVVADLYQLSFTDGKPDKEMKKEYRKGMKVTQAYVDSINDNWQDTAKLFIVDEKATEEYYKRSQETNDNRQLEKEIKSAAQVDILKQVVSAAVGNETKKGKNAKSE